MTAALRVRVLGGCDADLDGRPVDLGGPRQRAVLAVLLTARGAVVPADRVSDDLWRGEPPPRAAGALQAYVSHLRKALEPDRPPRAPATVLVSAPPGYAVRLPDEQVDAWRFEALVRGGLRDLPTDPERARRDLAEALALWRGTPYSGYADEEWAAPEVGRLEELRSVAVEHAAEAALAVGSPVEAVSGLERHAADHPLRESAWRLLALALYQSGRQADALAALRDLRRRLADELGVDPSPAVRQLEADILDHAPTLATPARPPSSPAQLSGPDVGRATPQPDKSADGSPEPEERAVFVGRAAELAALAEAAGRAARGAAQLALVAGEPGAGKSTVAAEAAGRLPGWEVVWGRCPEVEGAPALYPWSQVVRALPGETPAALAPLLDESAPLAEGDMATQRFRLHRAVGARLRDAAASRPLLVVLDDLHRADEETLALLVDVLPELADVPLLVLGTYRSAEVTEPLAGALAAVARYEPVRVDLAGLDDADASELVRRVAAAELAPHVVDAIVARTDGNPFYVRESARLAGAGGDLGDAGRTVPDGVRDVIGRRVARLPASAHTLLRLAAVQGREVDVDVLLDVSDLDEEEALDGLDSALVAGLVEEPEPGRLRFSHALVQEALYAEISLLRRGRWHARTGQSLERLRPGDHAALAHHFRSAGPAYDEQVVRYAALAAEQADRRHAYAASVDLWRLAIDAQRRRPGADPRELVELWIGLVHTLGHTAYGMAASQARLDAVRAALAVGDPVLTARAITAWDTPMVWATHNYSYEETWLMEQLVATAEHLTTLPQTDEIRALHCRLLATHGLEMEGAGDAAAMAAAHAAVVEARELGDPSALGYALDGLARQLMGNGSWEERMAVADEMRQVAVTHGLAGHRGLSHFLLEQAALAVGDLDAAAEHGSELGRQGEAFALPGLVVVSLQVPAVLALTRGELDEARARYAEFADALRSIGAFSVDALEWIAAWLIAYQEGHSDQAVEAAQEAAAVYPPVVPLLVRSLLAAGDVDAARVAHAGRIRPRRDLLRSMFAALDAENAADLGADPADLQAAYDDLLPCAGEIGGGASGFFVTGPVDTVLARLAHLLGRPEDAATFAAAAETLAAKVGNPRWVAEAEAVRAAVLAAD